MALEIPAAQSTVLSTMHTDGSRRWLHPRLALGRLLTARRLLAYVLIFIFTIIPYLHFNGRPLVLLDVPHREFTIFGFTFLPTDTVLLALFMVTLIVGICLATALLGRVWCGWMCPQTVYMEFVYRPLERLFDGPPQSRHRPGKKKAPWRTGLKYLAYLLISMYLAHTFLAYFVGVDALAHWVRRSPLEHPVSFLIMVAVTGLMLFDFSYFREQTCLVACPYGRFQSVMLDRDSLIVSYDRRRGEPRGHRSRRADDAGKGDCIDCSMCTDTCPTGIDIRNGLQMECIACTQCIDACNSVMRKVGKPEGLIRISSQARIEGIPSRLLRPRVVVYPTLMVVLVTVFFVVLGRMQTADVTILRGLGVPFTQTATGTVVNRLRVKVANRGRDEAKYRVELVGRTDGTLRAADDPLVVPAEQAQTTPVQVTLPAAAFKQGHCDVRLRVSDGDGFSREQTFRLLGPLTLGASAVAPQESRGG